MKSRKHVALRSAEPITALDELKTESDVEQKYLYPLLTNAAFLGIPSQWVRTKEYMSPSSIDKTAGKRYGYIPDYSVWIRGVPTIVVEAKAPDVPVEVALREARLYASEINKRYPPGVNPINYVLSSNGEQVALSASDSEVGALIVDVVDLQIGTSVLDAFRNAVGRSALEATADRFAAHFQPRPFVRTVSLMGGQAKRDEQLGVNEFAETIFPLVSHYFGTNTDEVSPEIVDRAYVSSDEVGTYEAVLETYLKDRTTKLAGTALKPIVTSRHNANEVSTEISRFAQNPRFYSRVQLVVGSVGSGKSLFARRFFRHLLKKNLADKTRWAFINFNVTFDPTESLQRFVAERFVESLCDLHGIDQYDNDVLEAMFSVEVAQFERGPAKALKVANPVEYATRRADLLQSLADDPLRLASSLARHISGDRGLGLVVIFDNVDKRSRDLQLKIFEAAQWFKDLTRSLVVVNLRDSTFEAHRDEPPLDAFINAVNFYISPPRFAQVIRKRLELLLEALSIEVDQRQVFSTETGYRISYPPSRLGEFVLSIYASLFGRRASQLPAALESLVAKDVRRALGMFSDIMLSPHIPTSQITGSALGQGVIQIEESRIIRALMRGRYRYFGGRSLYVRNILSADLEHNRPSNLLMIEILEYLRRIRKSQVDFTQEGYAQARTVVSRMSTLGFDEDDAFMCLKKLVAWGLVEPDSLVYDDLSEEEPVRLHAAGFMHLRYFLHRVEYLSGITTDFACASREIASEFATIWSSSGRQGEPSISAKKRILERLHQYFEFEVKRRSRRHAFYAEEGFGGRAVVAALHGQIERLGRGQLRAN